MKQLGRLLAYIERGKKYASTINSALIFIIFLQTSGVNLRPVHYLLLFLAAIVMYISVGFIDTLLGIRKMENYSNELNGPVHMETLRNTKEIKKLLKNT